MAIVFPRSLCGGRFCLDRIRDRLRTWFMSLVESSARVRISLPFRPANHLTLVAGGRIVSYNNKTTYSGWQGRVVCWNQV